MQSSVTRSIFGFALLTLLTASPALASPIGFDYTGYRLETIGTNTIGILGSSAGTVRTLFVAGVTPDAGTTASATQGGAAVSAPVYDAPSDQWLRIVVNPTAADLAPVTVTFANGADTATFIGRDLSPLTPMKLAQNLTVDASVDPFGPLFSWSLPTDTGDVDLIQIIFYSDLTNTEVGTRQNLAAGATSFDLYGPGMGGVLPLGYQLTVEVRMVDLFDDNGPVDVANVQRDSRAFINYSAPITAAVPEPSTYAMLAVGLLGIAGVGRKRGRRTG